MRKSRPLSGLEPTVFVVEDDEAVRESLRFLLSAVRHPVRAFATAEALLKAISKGQTGCVVLDINLPGMSGFELQARLAKRRAGLPVIFMTGKASKASRTRAAKTGAFGYLEKPLDGEVLLPLVRNAMEQGAAAADEPARHTRPQGRRRSRASQRQPADTRQAS